MSDIHSVRERVIRIEDKIDYLVSSIESFKSSQHEICEAAKTERQSMLNRIDSIERWKIYTTGLIMGL